MKLYFKRKVSAAHRLCTSALSYEDNARLFGDCSKLHGHEWLIEVWLDGKIDPETGMVINFNRLKDTIDVLDHACVNDFVVLPTAEHMCAWLIEKIRVLESFDSVKVKVWETENGCAENEWKAN